MILEIETKRLKLVPLTYELLRLCMYDRTYMELALRLNPTVRNRGAYETELELEGSLAEMMDAVSDAGNKWFWHTNWEIIHKDLNRIIGGLAFHDEPDLSGAVEIGYAVQPEFQNSGYATEAVSAAINWALNQSGVKCVRAEIEDENIPSVKVAISAGMKQRFVGDKTTVYEIFDIDLNGDANDKN